MQRATLGKSGSEASSQLQYRIARAFSSNSFVNTMDMTAAIFIYFDSSTIVRLSGLLQKVSNDDTWARWCIILRKRAGTGKMDYHMLRREYLLGCLGKLGEVSKQIR